MNLMNGEFQLGVPDVCGCIERLLATPLDRRPRASDFGPEGIVFDWGCLPAERGFGEALAGLLLELLDVRRRVTGDPAGGRTRAKTRSSAARPANADS